MQDKFIIKFLSCLLFCSAMLFSSDDMHFRFFISSDVKGETEPCGWKKKPSGGLARKCTVVNNSKEDRVVLFLDISRPVKYPFIQKITHKIASLTHREN